MPTSHTADLLLYFVRAPSLIAALYAIANLIDVFYMPVLRESASPVEFATAFAGGAWAICALCPFSAITSLLAKRVFLAIATLSAIPLISRNSFHFDVEYLLVVLPFLTPTLGLLAFRPLCTLLRRSAA